MKLLEEAKLRLAVIHALKVNSTIFVNSALHLNIVNSKHLQLKKRVLQRTSACDVEPFDVNFYWTTDILYNLCSLLSWDYTSLLFFSEHMHRSYNMTIAFVVLLAKILPGSCIPLLDWVKYRVDKTCWIYTCITVTQLTVNLLLFAENFSVRTGPCPID